MRSRPEVPQASSKAWVSEAPEATLAFGERLGRHARPGDVIALCGALGSGKTTLTQGIAKGVGCEDAREVRSPTFVVVSEHRGRCPLYHIDLYRVTTAEEASTVGYEGYLGGEGIAVIEWADRLADWLPEQHLRIVMEHVDARRRRLVLLPRGRRHRELALAAAGGIT